jgi:hypothetical protein
MRRLTPLAAFLAARCVLPSAFALEIHFSPEERLDAIDAAFIATAKHSIDLVGRHSKIGGMDGRCAQEPGVRRRLGERVKSTPEGSLPAAQYGRTAPQVNAPSHKSRTLLASTDLSANRVNRSRAVS